MHSFQRVHRGHNSHLQHISSYAGAAHLSAFSCTQCSFTLSHFHFDLFFISFHLMCISQLFFSSSIYFCAWFWSTVHWFGQPFVFRHKVMIIRCEIFNPSGLWLFHHQLHCSSISIDFDCPCFSLTVTIRKILVLDKQVRGPETI